VARLIPAIFDERTPPGERDVFSLLAAGPDNWVAIHSLDLAPWNRGLRTEIDFVVIVPDAGILCIEVKSHNNISFDGRFWHPKSIIRSPFKQACDGRHAFYRRLSEIAPQFKKIPVVHCCIFPRSSFPMSQNLSVQPWELMDLYDFRKFSSGIKFCEELKLRIKLSIEADAYLKELEKNISEGQVHSIVSYCVPVQKFRPDARLEIIRREEQIEKLLSRQQKPVVQLSEFNKRSIISGGAGTGKTLIAMEVARRWAERGMRVALLCYNKLIGNWMKSHIERDTPHLPNLIVGRAISVMAEMSGIKIPEKPTEVFWKVELPHLLENRLTEPEFKTIASFDFLVLDEAQDLLARPNLWQCLTQFLSGGISKGAFALFGDFENQVLTERNSILNEFKTLVKYDRPVRWKLTENCRNYRIVGDTAVKLAGIDQNVYSGYLRTGGSLKDYDIHFYSNSKEQIYKLRQYINEFKNNPKTSEY
jgi:hypothetical protein